MSAVLNISYLFNLAGEFFFDRWEITNTTEDIFSTSDSNLDALNCTHMSGQRWSINSLETQRDVLLPNHQSIVLYKATLFCFLNHKTTMKKWWEGSASCSFGEALVLERYLLHFCSNHNIDMIIVIIFYWTIIQSIFKGIVKISYYGIIWFFLNVYLYYHI